MLWVHIRRALEGHIFFFFFYGELEKIILELSPNIPF